MENEQILKKVIKKANKNGYKLKYEDLVPSVVKTNKDVSDVKVWLLQKMILTMYAPTIIFNHDFAKAFWGEKEHYFGEEGVSECKCGYQPYESAGAGDMCWKVYLQQMVIEEEPLKYLEQFIK